MQAQAASRLDATLFALADPTRRKVIDLLSKRPRRASDLATALSISRPLMSRHLKVLKTAGLVTVETDERDDARVRIYQLEPPRLTEVKDWLGEVEDFWASQLGALKAHAERKTRSGQ